MVIRYDNGKADDVISGERFVIAAGARSFVPKIDGLNEAGYLTSESFFGDKFPDKPWGHLAILGGGPISMEFAHIFSAYGSKVTIIELFDRILGREEEEISAFVTGQFLKNGVEILTSSKVTAVQKENDKKRLTVESNQGGSRSVLCDELFIASGVRSNADTLSMENAGIALDRHGWIPTNAYLETSQPHVFALGDINGKYQFRHKANYEAQVLANNLFSANEKTAADYSAVPWTIFTHPQVAHVGMTERELQEKGIAYRSAKNHYSEVVGGRAMGYRTGDDDDGFIKMLVGENAQILGAHIVGPQAAVLLQPFVYLMQMGYQCRKKITKSLSEPQIEGLRLLCPQMGGYASIMDSMVIHPSLNELTAWVFEKLRENLFFRNSRFII
jgi:dihydrolipoamide dehydrogenase